MCGIVGVSSNGPMTIPLKELFKSLLFHDVVRGSHATGVAAIDTHSRKIEVVKSAIPSPEFLLTKECEGLFEHKHNFNIYIGHNRWATFGDKKRDDYAHPFQHGNIVGVHNGSLIDQTLLDNHYKFVVDSDNIFYHMSENGLDDTISKLNGAYSLVWYDSEDNSLNFIRNNDRPMAVARLTGGTWVWASEIGMLRWLIKRHKFLKFDTVEDQEDKTKKEDFCYQLAVGHHYKIPYNGRMYQKPLLSKKSLPVFTTIPWRNGRNNCGSYGNYNLYGEENYRDKHLSKLSSKLKDDAFVEVRLVEIFSENIYTASSGKSEDKRRFVFEYKTHNDISKTIRFWNAGYDPFFNSVNETHIGNTFYGKISYCAPSLSNSHPSTINKIPGAPSNEEGGIVCSLFSVTRIRPNIFMSYNENTEDDSLTQQNDDIPFDNEDNDAEGNVIEPNMVETKTKKQLKIERRAERLRNGLKNLEKTTGPSKLSRDAALGVYVQLFNCRVDRMDMIDLSKSCHHRCSNCDKSLSSVHLAKLYVVTQREENGTKHQYALCSSECYNEMKQWIKEFEDSTVLEGFVK